MKLNSPTLAGKNRRSATTVGLALALSMVFGLSLSALPASGQGVQSGVVMQSQRTNCTITTPAETAYCPRALYAGPAKISSLDPSTSRNVLAFQAGYVSQGMLWRFNDSLEPKMDLLEKETVSKDGLTVTSTLRANLKYNDGSPVTAADAVFAFDRWKAAGVSTAYIAKIQSATATDQRTIVWRLTSPFPEFPYAMAYGILNLHPVDKVRANPTGYWTSPVSAGPMYVKEWSSGSDDIVLAANPAYWAKAQIGEATFRAVPDPASRQLALESGTAQYVLDLPIAAYQTLKRADVRVFPHYAPGMFMLTSNMVKAGSPLEGAGPGKFNRQAISAAVDRKQISDVAFFGLMKPACSQVYSTNNPYFRCSLPNDGRQDLKLARELLAKAGNPNGFTFELIAWNRPGWVEAANVIADNLKQIGVTAQVVGVPDAVGIARLTSGDYQMQFGNNSGPTPVFQMQNWFAAGGAWTTWARVVDPVITAALDRAAATSSAPEIKRNLYVANRLAYDSSAHIPLGDRFWVSGSRLPKGVLEAVTPGDLWMYVGTLPSLDTRPGVEDRVTLNR